MIAEKRAKMPIIKKIPKINSIHGNTVETPIIMKSGSTS